MKEHDNIMYANIQREIIEFERSVSIGMQDTTYDHNVEFWDSNSYLCHINGSNCHVKILLEFSAPQSNIVVYLFKEIKYLFLFIVNGTYLL